MNSPSSPPNRCRQAKRWSVPWRDCRAIRTTAAARNSRSWSAVFSAAKAWVRYFSEGLSRELTGSGVSCMALCPGFTHTEFHERGRMNMSRLPEFMWLDAAAVARQGLDDAAKGKIVSVPGVQYKTLVGVMNAVPRVLVRDVSSVIARRRRTQGS